MQHADAMHQDAAADQEHRRGAGDRQEFHELGCEGQQAASEPGGNASCGHCVSRRPRSSSLTMPPTSPYTPMVMMSAIADQHADLRREAAFRRPTPSEITMISADRMKSVRIAPLILSFSNAPCPPSRRPTALTSSAWCCSSSSGLCRKLVRQLLDALEAQVGAADHQQRRDRPRRERADRQRRRHQDRLVDQSNPWRPPTPPAVRAWP